MILEQFRKFGSVQKILTEDLNIRCVTAKFVPRSSTDEQKKNGLEPARNLFEYAENDENLMKTIIAGDKTRVFMATTLQLKLSRLSGGIHHLPTEKTRVQSNVKAMSAVFF